MSSPIERGLIFLRQGQHKRAEKEFRQGVAEEPNDARNRALLAICCATSRNHKEALIQAKESIALDPEYAFGHYAMAYCQSSFRRYAEAMTHIEEALRLQPTNADFWAMKASFHLAKATKLKLREAETALQCALTGLKHDPGHAESLRMRARALIFLDRKEAQTAVLEAMSADPSDGQAHELQGSVMLSGGDVEAARQHYEEALRLNPNSDSSRSGFLTSLKARHSFYKLLLNFLFPRSRRGFLALNCVIFAPLAIFPLAYVTPKSYASAVGAIAILIIVVSLIVSTTRWMINPIFNLLMRLDPTSRIYLSDDEVLAANLLAVVLVLNAVVLTTAICLMSLSFCPVILSCWLLLRPTVGTFAIPPGRLRTGFYFYLGVDFTATLIEAAIVCLFDPFGSSFKGSDLIAFFFVVSLGVSTSLSFFSPMLINSLIRMQVKYFGD